MQASDLVEILGVMMFGGDTLVAGLILTALMTVFIMGVMSLANPPQIAYIVMAFMGILIGMSLGWLDYWLAILIGIVSAAAIALKISEPYRGG